MAKRAKKRGVKPGTKRGKYKRSAFKPNAATIAAIKELEGYKYTPAQPLTLCGQLEDAILLLENRISNAIAKINSLM